jgi:phage protein D
VRGRREVFHRPVRSQREAEGLATAILRANAQGMIVGRGATVGIPQLRSGVKLAIGGLGPRFSGRYFTTSTTHTIGGSGYRTEFAARREAPLEESA